LLIIGKDSKICLLSVRRIAFSFFKSFNSKDYARVVYSLAMEKNFSNKDSFVKLVNSNSSNANRIIFTEEDLLKIIHNCEEDNWEIIRKWQEIKRTRQ